MNLKDCKFSTVHLLPAQVLIDAFNPEGVALEGQLLPAGAVVYAIVHNAPDRVLLAYTVPAQGLPQADVDRIVRLGVRKRLWLTEKEALAGLTEHALHQYGVPRLEMLSEGDYRSLASWLRDLEVPTGAPPPASSL